jgi:RHS repeat-associated protein
MKPVLKCRPGQMAALARKSAVRSIELQMKDRGCTVTDDSETGAVEIKDARGNICRITLDDHSRVATYSTPLARTTAFQYDDKNRLENVTCPNQTRIRFRYDEHGRLVGLSRGERHWVFESDVWDNPVRTIFPDGTFEQLEFSTRDELSCFTDRTGRMARFERDQAGRITEIVDGNGNRTNFDYGSWNRPSRIINPGGIVEDIARDAQGVLCSVSLDGKLWAETKLNASTQVEEIRYADGYFVRFRYDSAGAVIEAENPWARVKRQYDEQGRLNREDVNGQVVQYEYDQAGNLTRLTTPEKTTLEFGYDADGRLSSVRDWDGARQEFRYEDPDRAVERHLPTGIVERCEFTEISLPSTLQVSGLNNREVQRSLQFTYDSDDRLASLLDSQNGKTIYTYDAEGRILAQQECSTGEQELFEYDPAGNRVKVNGDDADFDAMNQMQCQGNRTMEYDARGNCIAISDHFGVTQFVYNAQNLLVAVDRPHAARIEYQYDAFARRIVKKVGQVITRYLWAGDQLLCEWTEGNPVSSRCDYLFVPGSFRPLAMRCNGETYYHHSDHLGTPRWVSDSTGRIVWSGRYAAFGESHSTGPIRQLLRFPGQYYDEETGLHYNRGRYYSPLLGRFLSRDPLGLTAGLNLYLYCENNPINLADPLGLWSGWRKLAVAVALVAVGVVAVVVAAPIVLGAVAGTAAVGAATLIGAAGAVVVGGGAIGAGVGLGLAPDGCIPCQTKAMVHGFLAGAGAALAVMSTAVAAIGAAGGGGMLALQGAGAVGGGTLTAGSAASLSGVAANTAVGASAVASGATVMMVGGAQGGGGAQGDDQQLPKKKMKAKDRRRMNRDQTMQQRGGEPKEGTPRSNQAQNQEFNDAARGLSRQERRRLHDEITKQNMSREEIIQRRNEMFPDKPYSK